MFRSTQEMPHHDISGIHSDLYPSTFSFKVFLPFRMTTYAPPVNKTLHTASALPFVAHVTPFALPENDEMDIPLVDFGEASGGVEECSDPLRYKLSIKLAYFIYYISYIYCTLNRCSNCEGFINPHVSWVLGGEQWECNLCCHRNRTPSW